MLSKINHPLVVSGHWQTIAKGSSNQLYRAEINHENYVLRINASDEIAFGVKREREAKVLQLIANESWAPKVIENNVTDGWCLMHDHGSSASLNKDIQESVVNWIKQLQLFSQSLVSTEISTEPAKRISKIDKALIETLTFDLQVLLDKYICIFNKASGKQLPLRLCKLLADTVKRLPTIPSGIIHQDLHLGNVLQHSTGGGITVIDWEYGGWGMPWLDIAALSSAFDINIEQLKNLPVFQSISPETFQEGLTIALEINEGLACIWYWLRGDLKGLDHTQSQPLAKDALILQAQQLIERLEKQ